MNEKLLELIECLRDHMDPDEIVDYLGVDADELVDALTHSGFLESWIDAKAWEGCYE